MENLMDYVSYFTWACLLLVGYLCGHFVGAFDRQKRIAERIKKDGYSEIRLWGHSYYVVETGVDVEVKSFDSAIRITKKLPRKRRNKKAKKIDPAVTES